MKQYQFRMLFFTNELKTQKIRIVDVQIQSASGEILDKNCLAFKSNNFRTCEFFLQIRQENLNIKLDKLTTNRRLASEPCGLQFESAFLSIISANLSGQPGHKVIHSDGGFHPNPLAILD